MAANAVLESFMNKNTTGKSEKTHSITSRLENMKLFFKSHIFLLVIIMFCGIGFRVYKMHSAGIVADEAWTYRDFCTDLNTALTKYSSTNNHLLSSALIVMTRKIFGGYEHFIRIPAMLSAVLFCAAITVIVHKTIRSSALKVILLLFILFNWFIFDLNILARGYSIALAATFAGIAVLISVSCDNKNHKKNWLMALLFIAMNFLAFGSMLSSLSIILGINAAYFTLLILNAIKQDKKALINAIARMIVIVLGSAASLYLLYYRVFSVVIRRGKGFKMEPLNEYIKKILWEPFIYIDFSRMEFNKTIYNASLTLLVVATLICLLTFLYRLAAKQYRSISLTGPAALILLLTAAVSLLMIIQNKIFGISLGMPRNGVFLVTLMLLSSGIIIDQAASTLSNIKPFAFLFNSACIALLATLCFLNIPSSKAINVRPYDWGKQSAVGPLVRILRQIDPDKDWKIKLTSPYLAALEKPLKYYAKFGYKVERVTKEYDVVMVPEHTPKGGYVYLKTELFQDHHCNVIVNTDAFKDKDVFFQLHY